MTSQLSGAILVVDESKPQRKALSQLLAGFGHAVTVADSGRQALAILLTHKFDLVVLSATLANGKSVKFLQRLGEDQDLPLMPVMVFAGPEQMAAIAQCLAAGAEDHVVQPVEPPLLRSRIQAALERQRLRDDAVLIRTKLAQETKRAEALLQLVIPLGVALSAEKDFDRLLERILLDAKLVCNADGGTLYLVTPDRRLKFEIVRNDTLNLALGGTTRLPVQFEPLHLYDEATGEPNHHNVATHTALTGAPVNLPDAYQAAGFDFSGTRAFDKQSGYRSKSFLTIPLKNHGGEVIGVLQLINARDASTGQVIAFAEDVQKMVESLSALATVALEAYLREQRLKDQIRELQIEIDEVKKLRQVAEITETEYFQDLRRRAQNLRAGRK